jgi:hypothetical protein
MEANLSTYVAPVACTNCGYEGDLEAPIGETVGKRPCPCCVVVGNLRPNNQFWNTERRPSPRYD